MANAGYGKHFQGQSDAKVVDLTNSYRGHTAHAPMPHSQITNFMIGSYITSMTRAVIGEILNHSHRQGHHVYTVTTDSLTTDKIMSDWELACVGPITAYLSKLSRNDILGRKSKGDAMLVLRVRGYSMVSGEKPLASLTGVTVPRGDKAKWIFEEWNKLSPFDDTKYQTGGQYGIREWFACEAKPVQKKEMRRFNWDYDLKGVPLDPVDRDGRVFFDIRQVDTFEEYIHNRRSYKAWLKSSDPRRPYMGNKLQSAALVNEFSRYTRARKDLTGFKYQTKWNNERVFANAARRYAGLSYGQIAGLLGVPRSSVQYWVNENHLSDGELESQIVKDILEEMGCTEMGNTTFDNPIPYTIQDVAKVCLTLINDGLDNGVESALDRVESGTITWQDLYYESPKKGIGAVMGVVGGGDEGVFRVWEVGYQPCLLDVGFYFVQYDKVGRFQTPAESVREVIS